MNFRKALAFSLLAPLLFTAGASAMINNRFSHAAVLLPDGNMLFTGGSIAGNMTSNTVEMYNMATNSYQAWGALNTGRSSHTATLMSDGRVLIAGGIVAGGAPTTSLEVCRPLTSDCITAGNMTTARAWHTATPLSKGPNAGKVLLCGGRTGLATSSHTATETCEFFTPGANGTTAAGTMVSPRMGHTAVLLQSGRVFISGGVRAGGGGSPEWVYEPMNEMYEPSSNQWTPVSAMLKGRINHTATVLNNGKILIAGGYNEANRQVCMGDEASLEYDCWHILNFDTGQNNGNLGYLDGAEFYDQNGGRVILSEENQWMMPYRVSQHSAALTPDGKWRIHGGYGNIFPTFFSNAPALTDNTTFFMTQMTNGTTHFANISNTSIIEFPLDFSLSRSVSGRLVSADAFISGPATPGLSSVEFDAVKIYLPASVARLDGAPVGTLLCGDAPTCDYKPGDFNGLTRLYQPGGTASFEKISVPSGGDDNPTTAVSPGALVMNPNPLLPTEGGRALTGNFTTNVAIAIPDVFGRIKGVAKILSGRIGDNNGEYTINLEEGGRANFDFNALAPTSCDHVEDRTCIYSTQLTFVGIQGQVSNLTTLEDGTTFYTGAWPEGVDLNTALGSDPITLSLELDFMAREVYSLDREPAYSFDRSTTVVREMIFTTQLAYDPSTNRWDDLDDLDVSPTLYLPAFNHTAMLTPANDTWVLGGRNCEANPGTDCLRATKRFLPVSSGTINVPVFRSEEGTTDWPLGKSLVTKRAFHTSTVLPTGHILTCGGSDGARPLKSCELMDPATKVWTQTASMNMERANHTATLLPNGNVLVAGGVNPSGIAISSAEVFYPDTQRWVPTSQMTYARQLHSATLLPDGNVLVAGGATLSTYAATAELYISSTAYWLSTVTGLVNGRSQHTATLLKNGNVLLAGGVNGYGPMRQAEVYNYQNRSFSAANPLNKPRYAHTATLLRDGNVLVAGGSDGVDATGTCELYNGTNWAYTQGMNYPRANHRTVLLPNGKLMATGGEFRSVAQAIPMGFDPDYRGWSEQGQMTSRSHHTSVMTKDNKIMNIGGWSGGAYLASTEYADFNFYPDMNGLDAETTRQALISTGTVFFDRAANVTLQSGTSNFHGITEASGGGAGPMNSSYANPRVYMQQIDNQSGFMIDLSTRIYSTYGGLNTAWERTVSSITILMPALQGELPHGWYHMRTAAAGQFSDAHTVQVTVPRPVGVPTDPTGTVLGTSSITWTWTRGTIPVNGADGYTIYSATDNVFITTVAFANTAAYTQSGMAPNTAASVKVSAFNLGGSGALATSVTYYTLAATPEPLNITAASFETALLEWTRNSNSELTTYEVSMAPTNVVKFSDPLSISTPVPFSVNYMSTSTVVTSLSANQPYDFRVRAMNGAGLMTAFTTPASTLTISGVNNFTGQALSSSTINWSWDASVGASYYEVYDITNGTATAVLVDSATANDLNQTGLSANRQYTAVVAAVKDNPGLGPIHGPPSPQVSVYTLTVAPLPATPNVFSNVSTGSLTANWITNGNSAETIYAVSLTTGTSVSTFTTTENRMAFPGLAANIRHDVTVQPYNGDGIAGSLLDLGYKYTLAKVPASLTADEISMSGISLSWNPDGNSAETVYEVRSSTSDVFANPVTTHQPFSWLETGTSLFVNGLLTGTSYYFDVAACNGEGLLTGCTSTGVTARKRSVAAFTLPGPSGAPAGSIGGTSDPAATSVITGTLPNGSRVTLTVPAGAFATTTAIAISSSITNACGSYAIGGKTVEVAIYTQDNAQPQEPVTLQLTYTGLPVSADIPNLVMARYNPVSGQCLPLETKIDQGYKTVTATLNHFSVFQLMVRSAASDLSNVLVYPNPFYTNRGQGFVTIDRIPANAKVRIYTLSGDKVWESAAGSSGMVIWKGVNSSGSLVASGIYLAVVDSSAGKKVLKLAVER
ncbi:MAG: kelch repeat-containing protein [Elusimicrobiales bacterium]|nr:kelch repeat-containing protein [Elusimicrobiales bacterium]